MPNPFKVFGEVMIGPNDLRELIQKFSQETGFQIARVIVNHAGVQNGGGHGVNVEVYFDEGPGRIVFCQNQMYAVNPVLQEVMMTTLSFTQLSRSKETYPSVSLETAQRYQTDSRLVSEFQEQFKRWLLNWLLTTEQKLIS